MNLTVGILADIHGNLAALEAVLADLEGQSVDRIVFGGDLVMNGPRPAETLARIRGLDAGSVVGNTDVDVLRGSDPAGAWARDRLSSEDVAYLESLPLGHRVSPTTNRAPDQELLVVHSTPRDCYDLLVLEPHPLGTSFFQPTPPEEAVPLLNGERAAAIVYGHIHYFSSGTVNDQALKSIGSVGLPFDGDPRAAYTLARWDGTAWKFEDRRVAYDHEAVAREIEASDMPMADRYAWMIREANWFPKSEDHAGRS